jgi:hypothetical protein
MHTVRLAEGFEWFAAEDQRIRDSFNYNKEFAKKERWMNTVRLAQLEAACVEQPGDWDKSRSKMREEKDANLILNPIVEPAKKKKKFSWRRMLQALSCFS